MRLAVVASHPIQYQTPLFRVLARESGVDFTALFCHDHGIRPSFDERFDRVIQYDTPLLDGYPYRFLRNMAFRPSLNLTGQFNPEVCASLATNEFDAIVFHGYATATNLLALFALRGRTRLLMRGDSNLLQRRTLERRVIKQALLRPLFARVDHFLTIGTRNHAYYASYGVPDTRMTCAPYSVDNDHFINGSDGARRDPDAARRSLGLPLGLPLFLFCGKLMSIKRPLDVLHAFARARSRIPCALVFVGDGALRSELDSEIDRLGLSSDVHRLGFRNQSELPSIYGVCDVLVLPSELDAWGLVVNEAMAAGVVPVVSDRVGCGPDLVEDDCIYPVGDVETLSEILWRFASRPDDLRAARLRAADRIGAWGLRQTAQGFVRGAEAAIRA